MLAVYMDPNYWGLFVVPIGILVCFSPVLITWAFFTKPDEPEEMPGDDKH